MKQIEPSDIVKLLSDMAQQHNDATCHKLCELANQGEPILNVCFIAIQALAGEKANYFKQAVNAEMRRPPGPIVISKDKLE